MAQNPENSDQLLMLAMLLSIAEAARVLGISRTVFYRLIAQGEIRCIGIGRRRLVARTELQDFIARQSPAAPNPTPEKAIAARQRRMAEPRRRNSTLPLCGKAANARDVDHGDVILERRSASSTDEVARKVAATDGLSCVAANPASRSAPKRTRGHQSRRPRRSDSRTSTAGEAL